MKDNKERELVYSLILTDFDTIQNSHGKDELSFGLCAYFITKGFNIDEFPEIIKHKPSEDEITVLGGYWLDSDGRKAIEIRRKILLDAILNSELEEMGLPF